MFRIIINPKFFNRELESKELILSFGNLISTLMNKMNQMKDFDNLSLVIIKYPNKNIDFSDLNNLKPKK